MNNQYLYAKEKYAEIGIDTDAVIEKLGKVAVSLHCWQGDDVGGFDSDDALSGGIQATGLSELDRVLGGGLVCGSVVLLSGEPGIGKSTLLLQICDTLGADKTVLYVSGEESRGQLKLRADRLHTKGKNLYHRG